MKNRIVFFTLIVCLLMFIPINAQKLVNPNATPEAIALKTMLDTIYGKKIISGQMDDSYLQYIIDATGGKQPAMMGYDFNGICPSQGGNNDAQKAIKWVKEQKGIAQFQWHWISPDENGDFYTKNFNLASALSDTSRDSYKHIIRDIDLVAVEMKKMQDAKIAILWRPLHEAEGAWFWWGMNGGSACKKLWAIMYERMVNYHKINNLIWVWNSYGTTKQNWYPADSTVDIIAWDYPDYSPNTGSWSQYKQMFGMKDKPFGIGEDGKLFDPELLKSQQWLYFLTWSYMIKDPSQKDGKNTKDWLFKVYNDSRVITLDDLTPGPKAYAGKSALYFDMDGDSQEVVLLDGSASYTKEGTITSYIWYENNQKIAEGVKPSITLALGSHNIELKITTSTNETKSSKINITIKKPSLSLNKPFKVSSTEANYGNLAANALDGNESTRWSSLYADPQWFQIDLGKPYSIQSVVINWEVASGKNFDIEESNDGINWTKVLSKTNMPAGARIDNFTNLEGGARYIRLYGYSRNTSYGFSIFEFEVFGVENPNATPVGTPANHETTDLKQNKSGSYIYPTNVSYGQKLHLSIDKNAVFNHINIYNIEGKLISNYKVNNNKIDIDIDNNFLSGMYVLKLESDLNTECYKFFVK